VARTNGPNDRPVPYLFTKMSVNNFAVAIIIYVSIRLSKV